MAGIINASLSFLLTTILLCLDVFLISKCSIFQIIKDRTTYVIRRFFSNYMIIVISQNQQEGISHNNKHKIENEYLQFMRFYTGP